MKELFWNAFAVIGMTYCMAWGFIALFGLWERFKKWDKSRKTWVMQTVAFIGLWRKRRRTGWTLAERVDIPMYDVFIANFEKSNGIGWMKRACVRWLKADRLKKYPDYLTATQEYEVWGGTVNDLTVEHVRAYTEAQAQEIAEKRKPDVHFNMVITRQDGKQ